MLRRRIAVITSGGLAGGLFNQGIPALVELFSRLNRRFDLHAFQAGTLTSAERGARDFPVTSFAPGAGGIDLVAKLASAHVHERYALIHGLWASGTRLALRAAAVLRVPVVMSLLGGEVAYVPEVEYGGVRSERDRRRLVRACRRAAVVTTVSAFQREKLRVMLPDEAAQIVYLGVDTEKFRYADPPPGPPYRFIHVANLTEVKDQRTLVTAFGIIRKKIDSHLTIVGPDYLSGQLQALVASLGLGRHVTFAGPVRHSDLPIHYRKAHILLHSSLYESQAVTVLEAMSCGVAVVGTDVGVLADLRDRCCLTTAPKDSDGLARLALALLDDPNLLRRLRRSARAWAAAHSSSWTAERYEEIYDKLTS